MRWVSLLVGIAASVAHAAPSSNPAFLGIEMTDDLNGCVISGVKACSPARDAGLRTNDIITGMDGKPLVDGNQRGCAVLQKRIVGHAPNDVVAYNVMRGSENVAIRVALSTRADVQHRCFVGKTLPEIDVVDLDNHKHKFDLGELRGGTAVIGWVRLERCAGCGPVFDAIADGIKQRSRDGERAPALLGITPRPLSGSSPNRIGLGSTVPFAVASIPDFDEHTLKEDARIQFMVVDARGVIRFVTPIAPDSDDLESLVDELLAAVEQCERRSKR